MIKNQVVINTNVNKVRTYKATIKLGFTAPSSPIAILTPFENEIGTVTPSRVGVGVYEINSPLLLTAKTYVQFTPPSNSDIDGKVELDTLNDKITIRHYDNQIPLPGLKDPNPEDYFGFIEILIYP